MPTSHVRSTSRRSRRRRASSSPSTSATDMSAPTFAKRIHLMSAKYALLAASLTLTLAACEEPTVGNYNSPTVEAAGADPSALQLQATGLLSQLRGPMTAHTSDVGIFGRESFNYFPTDGRSHTHYVNFPGAGLGLDYSGFAAGGNVWNAAY